MRSHRIPMAAVAVALAVAVAVPTPARDAEDRFRKLAAAAGQDQPLVRIGLSSGPRLLVSSSRRFRIVDPDTGDPVWRKSYGSEVAVVAEGAGAEPAKSVFRIQVAAFSTEAAARAELSRLAGKFGVPGVVHYVPDRGTWRVRLGRAGSRDRLSSLMARLRGAGLTGLWIAEEPAQAVTGVTLRLVDTQSYDSRATGLARIAVVPAGAGSIRVEDRPYRGVMELRVSPYGTVRAVNWVDLEHYLRGVVPAELGPEVWPQIEALKAQAVAARTYVWGHLGQFEDEGFDLCATPRCQVYKGRSAEHPLTDRAVEETAGEILTWEGLPISAMYTATCGGHTEDAGEIFPEERAPYLRGVPCRAEGDALGKVRIGVRGRKVEPVLARTGEDVTRHRALLEVAGVLGDPPPTAADLDRPLRPDDLEAWTRALARLAGRKTPSGAAPATSTLGEAVQALVLALGWDPRTATLIGGDDLPAILEDREAASLPDDQRRSLAYLAMEGLIRPFPDGAYRVDEQPARSRILPVLAGAGERYRAFGLQEATVSSREGDVIRAFRGKREIRLALGRDPVLFGRSAGIAVPMEELLLWPGDRIRYRQGGDGRIDFLERMPPVKGVSDDRSASVYSWEVRRTRKKLESTINRRVDVGRLLDLEVVRRGVSGRVVELRVVGDKASTVVKGFDIRNLLDLRELLFVHESQRTPDGRLEAVVFSGKGWGHGIGLCQVGAYGMALRGKTYREILAHYYTGPVLDRIR